MRKQNLILSGRLRYNRSLRSRSENFPLEEGCDVQFHQGPRFNLGLLTLIGVRGYDPP